MSSPDETSTLLDASIPVTQKRCKYDFSDQDALSAHGMYSMSAFLFLNFGLLSCYVVCGLIIAALSNNAFI